jgi:hypothetical protein
VEGAGKTFRQNGQIALDKAIGHTRRCGRHARAAGKPRMPAGEHRIFVPKLLLRPKNRHIIDPCSVPTGDSQHHPRNKV